MCLGPSLLPFCHTTTNVLGDSVIGLDEVETSKDGGDTRSGYEDHQYANKDQEATRHDID